MADFVNTIDLLGDEATAKAIIEGTMTEYNDDTINSIGGYAFYRIKTLTSINLPNATSIGVYAFGYCEALQNVNLPNVTSIINYAFASCSALTSIDLPNVTRIGDSAFSNCSKLTSVDLPNATSIGSSAFSNCSKLTTIILRSPTVCTLNGTNAFANTPFAAGRAGGTACVPQALITEYQNATNWSTLYAAGTCNFVAIEGSEYE